MSDKQMSVLRSRTFSICHKEQNCQRPYQIEDTLDERTIAVYMYTLLTLEMIYDT
jgi:hypothetical protein